MTSFTIKPNPLATLLRNNRARVKNTSEDHFSKHANGQSPEILFIACADSRVDPGAITQSDIGEQFVGRNVANLVTTDDKSMLATVRYAISHLNIKHIVICGHYGCGGIKAAMDIAEKRIANEKVTIEKEISDWLKPVIELYNTNRSTLIKIESKELRYKKFVQLNVEKQMENMSKLDSFKETKIDKNKETPLIHGAVYDIKTGKLLLIGAHKQELTSLISKQQEEFKNNLDESSIKSQLVRLSSQTESYNPFSFIGAQVKHAAICKALTNIKTNGLSISKQLDDITSPLYLALNQKRLAPFTFLGFNQVRVFSYKSTALLRIEEEDNKSASDELLCRASNCNHS